MSKHTFTLCLFQQKLIVVRMWDCKMKKMRIYFLIFILLPISLYLCLVYLIFFTRFHYSPNLIEPTNLDYSSFKELTCNNAYSNSSLQKKKIVHCLIHTYVRTYNTTIEREREWERVRERDMHNNCKRRRSLTATVPPYCCAMPASSILDSTMILLLTRNTAIHISFQHGQHVHIIYL